MNLMTTDRLSMAYYALRPPHPERREGGRRLRGLAAPVEGSRPGPLVSVVTIVRNAESTLERTMLSVLGQSYGNIEYIVIDGGSTDGTIDIIRKYDDRIAYWLSEPDEGISDAFNKGVAASTGEIIGILNADDLLSPNQVEQGVMALLRSSADYVFGDLLFHDANGRTLYRIDGDPNYRRIIHSKMPELCHPTVLVRKAAYERIGLFDTRYRYAMDYEWLLRLHVDGGNGLYVRSIVGHMGTGGASDRSFTKALEEVRDISVRYGKNRVHAELLYRYRLAKGAGRRLLEAWIPKPAFDRLRNLFNPRYMSKK
jgi:glycosyltransferase involved in cell wall biosynthesis